MSQKEKKKKNKQSILETDMHKKETYSNTTSNWKTGGIFSPKSKNKVCSVANMSCVKSTVAVTLPITSQAAHISHLLDWSKCSSYL